MRSDDGQAPEPDPIPMNQQRQQLGNIRIAGEGNQVIVQQASGSSRLLPFLALGVVIGSCMMITGFILRPQPPKPDISDEQNVVKKGGPAPAPSSFSNPAGAITPNRNPDLFSPSTENGLGSSPTSLKTQQPKRVKLPQPAATEPEPQPTSAPAAAPAFTATITVFPVLGDEVSLLDASGKLLQFEIANGRPKGYGSAQDYDLPRIEFNQLLNEGNYRIECRRGKVKAPLVQIIKVTPDAPRHNIHCD